MSLKIKSFVVLMQKNVTTDKLHKKLLGKLDFNQYRLLGFLKLTLLMLQNIPDHIKLMQLPLSLTLVCSTTLCYLP